MRSPILDSDSRSYWDALAPQYRRITRISCADFHYGPQIPGEKVLKILPPLKAGMSALELGCGGAENSVWLARRGLKCDAFDISEAQLEQARKIAAKRKVDINLFQASLSDFRANAIRPYNSDSVGANGIRPKYDFLHSSHAMEFAADPAAVVRDMAAVMKPGAWLMISTVHPLYNGEWMEMEEETTPPFGHPSAGGEISLNPPTRNSPPAEGCPKGGVVGKCEDTFRHGLFLTNYFSPPDDIRDEFGEHIISRAHSISDWFKWSKAAGLSVEDLRDPPAVKNAPYTSDDWAEAADGHLSAVPSTVIFLVRKLRI